MEDTAEKDLSVCTDTVDVRILDFRTANRKFYEGRHKRYQHLTILFQAEVNCVGKDCLSVKAYVSINGVNFCVSVSDLKWAASIIDKEGNAKFTRYYASPWKPHLDCPRDECCAEPEFLAQCADSCCPKDTRYLKKSFILERDDEFLSDGAIILRCDIYFDFNVIKAVLSNHCDRFGIFMYSIPKTVCYKNAAETGNSSDTYTVFDYTKKVLTLPHFHELRKRFGVYGISPVLESPSSESKEETTDILEHVWIFDTRPDRFLLSFAPIPGNVGHQLVLESPVIRRCVEAPMKEKREKRVEFSDVDSQTFQTVLYFLKSGEIKYSPLSVIAKAYDFSQLYEMINLRQKCAEHMTIICKSKTELETLEKVAKFYSDEYLSLLLEKIKPDIMKYSDT